MARLTKRTVDAADHRKIIAALDADARRTGKPIGNPDRDVFLWDDDLPGFGLKLTHQSGRVFIYQYRNAEGRTRRVTMGKAAIVTPEEARALARNNLADVVKGADPAQAKQNTREARTVKDLAKQFETDHIATRLKPSSQREYRRLMQDVIVPALGNRRVVDVTRADVSQLHHSLRAHPTQANRALAVLSKFMSAAEVWGLRPDGTNPCRHVQKNKERPRKRYLSGPEFARLADTLTTMEGRKEDGITSYVALLFRLLVLTGCRVSEVLTLKWEYVDFENGVLNLPDSKTGSKTVVIGAPAIDLLRRATRQAGCPWVIVGSRRDADRNPTHHANPSKAWQRIKAEAKKEKDGLPDVDIDDVTIHDLRHSFASVGAGGGLSLPRIGALLGHTQSQTTMRYAHLADDPLREAADFISGEIAAMMAGTPPAAVVAIGEAKKG